MSQDIVAKHTPGPWHWDSDPVKGDPTGRIRYRVVALGKTIAQTYYSSYEGGLTNAEADTRLIAAAPDLLEALESISAWVESQADGQSKGGHATFDLMMLRDQRDAARAAIAKATGVHP